MANPENPLGSGGGVTGRGKGKKKNAPPYPPRAFGWVTSTGTEKCNKTERKVGMERNVVPLVTIFWMGEEN